MCGAHAERVLFWFYLHYLRYEKNGTITITLPSRLSCLFDQTIHISTAFLSYARCGEWPIYLDCWNLLRPKDYRCQYIFFSSVSFCALLILLTDNLMTNWNSGICFWFFGVHKNATNEPPTINQWSMTDFTVTNLHKKAWNFDSFSKLICSEWPIKDT